MASLAIVKGPNEGKVIALEGDRFLLGRNPGCAVVIPVTAVSREHAQILRLGGKFFIEDKQSRNGTFVNNQAINARTPLKNSDRIRICDFVAVFLDSAPALDDGPSCAEATTESESNPSLAFAPLFRSIDESVPADEGWLMDECRHLAGLLARGHVCCDYGPGHYQAFRNALTVPSSAGHGILAEGFHRVVTFDARKGTCRGAFRIGEFYGHAVERLVEAFSLRLGRTAEPEDVFQILRDEPRSLLCILEADCIPDKELYRIRSFTQDRHAALLLCRK